MASYSSAKCAVREFSLHNVCFSPPRLIAKSGICVCCRLTVKGSFDIVGTGQNGPILQKGRHFDSKSVFLYSICRKYTDTQTHDAEIKEGVVSAQEHTSYPNTTQCFGLIKMQRRTDLRIDRL